MSKQFCRKDSTIHGVGRLAKVLSDGLSLKEVGEALGIETSCNWTPRDCVTSGERCYSSIQDRGVVDPPKRRGEQQVLPVPTVAMPIRGRRDDNDAPPRLGQEHLCVVSDNAREEPAALAAVRWGQWS